MPANACVAVYDCKGCGATLRPLRGSCCVFCSYGSVPCPPVQAGVEPCCTPISEQDSKDWLGNTLTSSVTWWIPTALVVVGLLASVPWRTSIWMTALLWMGRACLLNARRSGCTHCRFTGPYYIAMVAPSACARCLERVFLRLLGAGGAYSFGRQDHLVDDRANLGNFLVARLA